VQQFLADEYRVVKEMLRENRVFVDAIAELLLQEAVVDQRGLMELAPSDACWRRAEADVATPKARTISSIRESC
jgi:hypothetical protein